MPFDLKNYQQDCLDRLIAYLRKARELTNSDTAFYDQTQRTYRHAAGLEGLPYICIRVPTGGGKTAIAAYAVQPMVEDWLQSERGVVLWLAPSSTIVKQTLDALKDRQHPYRKALGRLGEVTVVNLGAALALGPGPYRTGTVVLVTTVQSLRQEDPQGLRVYRDDGYLMEHFTLATSEQKEVLLSRAKDGSDVTTPTLCNVLRMHRPIVIVDEAHNVRTDLSFETLSRFDPSALLEITATPADDSNVLYSVSAAELKAEQMIKLPVELYRRDRGRDSIAQAVAKRDVLEELAKADEAAGRKYVRPIVLYHAESKGGDLTPKTLKKLLIEELKIQPDQIAIETGSTRELPETPILSKVTVIRHIITIQALREGWDCSFAYILCSVANLSAKTAVEQLLGRVLRMPHAKLRGNEALNRAYCYATGESLAAATEHLEEAIVESGFSRFEAKRAVLPHAEPGPGLFGQTAEPVAVSVGGTVSASIIRKLPKDEQSYISVSATAAGTKIQWQGPPMSEEAAKRLTAAVSEKSDREQVERLRRLSAGEDASPSALGHNLDIPGLAVKRDNGQWELLDDQPLEVEWELTKCDATLTDSAFPLRAESSRGAEIDISEKGKVVTREVETLDRQLVLLEHDAPQTPKELAVWLDRAIRDHSIIPSQKIVFLDNLVQDQIDRRGIALERLVRNRHRLKEAAAAKIAAHRLHAESQEYLRLLKETATDLTCCISFPSSYPANELYTGSWEPRKHFYSDVGDMNDPEEKVAKYIDALDSVLYWVRNLDSKPAHALWFPLADGKFYPDFVAELVGEKYLVVEYKGMLEGTAKEEKKRQIGELWAAKAPDELAFVWCTKDHWQEKIDEAIARLSST